MHYSTCPKDKEKNTVKDAASGAVYQVTNSSSSPSVIYTKSSGSKEKVLIVPDTITKKGVTYKVTAIASNAFKGNKTITKIVIGKNVTSIGNNAFSGCSRLKTIQIGSSVKTIGSKAFYKCTSLRKVTIPAKVSKIGKQAFYGCKKIKNITIKSKKLITKTVGKDAFKGISAKSIINVSHGKNGTYKKLLRTKGVGKKAKIV